MSKQERDPLPPPQNLGEKRRQFKGVRMRKWGKWVSEVRIPNSRAKLWLGSYDTAEQAARAFDAAIFCLRGAHAKFNFPDALPAIPSASALSRQQIQLAAAKYARGHNHIPSTCKTNDSALPEKAEPPISSTLSVMETLSDSLLMSEDLDFVFGESSLLSDGDQLFSLDKLFSDDAKFFDGWQFWNF